MSTPEKTIEPCHSCGAPMDVSAVPPFSNVECPVCGKQTRVKREFGPYTLTRRLAIGGMSMVFTAHDSALNREVALKILSEAYSADEKRIKAFEDEARLTASLGHPNIVRVYTTGNAFGRFYIAMELVPGGHFEQRIHERGSIPEEELLPVAIDVAEGLKAAHSAGLIHRDVKPGNILLDTEDRAKLVDFGLALVTQGGSATAAELWATPYYVPPETIEGAPEDFRSDIYAFGATLYHSLTGNPSCAEETMATDLLRAAKRKIVPLSSLNHPSTEETREIIDKAMAYDPANRYQDYDSLLADLHAALANLRAGDTLRLSRSAVRRQLKKQKARNRILAIAAGAAALVVSGAVLVAILRRKVEPPPVVHAPPPVEAAPSAPDDSAEMARLYREAREALARRDYPVAGEKFHELFRSERIQEPTRSWAGVESVVALYLQAKPAEAREAARETSLHIKQLKINLGIGRSLPALLDHLHQPQAERPPDDPEGAPGVVTALLAGLKNWQRGQIEPAAACFGVAASVKLPHHSRWAAEYQEIARQYQHDARLLALPVFDSLPRDVAGCDKALAELEKLSGEWKTEGRATFNARAWEIDLRRHRKLLADAPPPIEAPEDPLPAALDLISRFQFAKAGQLAGASADPKAKGYLFLADAAAGFLADLEADLANQPPTPPLRLRSGETISNLSLTSPGKLTAVLDDGSRTSCSWHDIAPETLVDLHRALVATASDSDRPARHERAIAFDWLVGDRARATEAAAKLAALNPSFKSRWEEAVPPLGN